MPEAPSPPPLPTPRPKGVRAVRTRRADGTEAVYWYCRRTGARLPDFTDPGFAAELARVRKGPGTRHLPGSLGELLADWRGSQEWAVTARATKDSRDRYLIFIEAPAFATRQAVDLPPQAFRKLRADLLDMRDAIARERGKGAAYVFGQAVGSLFAWAVDRGRIAISPMTRLKALGGGHIPAWPEADALHAMKTWPEPIRRAVVLNYHLGQRRGDLTQLRWTAYDAGAGIITLQPEKTRRKREAAGRAPYRLIVSKALAWELQRWRLEAPDAEFILLNGKGKPWTKGALSMAVREQLLREGWDTKRGLHGLRRLGAVQLYEAGVSLGGIGAARGWDSERTVKGYTDGADQERMARAAIDRLEKSLSKGGKRRR